MNTVGFTGILNDEIAVFVNPSRVTLGSGVSFGCVMVRMTISVGPDHCSAAGYRKEACFSCAQLHLDCALALLDCRCVISFGVSLQMPDFLEALPKALNRKWSADVQSVGPDGGSSSDSLAAQEVGRPWSSITFDFESHTASVH